GRRSRTPGAKAAHPAAAAGELRSREDARGFRLRLQCLDPASASLRSRHRALYRTARERADSRPGRRREIASRAGARPRSLSARLRRALHQREPHAGPPARWPRGRHLRASPRRHLRPDLLIVDDFGLKALVPPAPEDLYEIVNERYERGSLIITSNRAFAEWPDLFHSPLLASAAL